MGKILLEDMEFFAYHGCFHEEQIIGTKFLVNLVIEADTSRAEHSDHLNETINYTELYRIVKEQMEIKSHLLENVSARIVNSILLHFAEITYVEIKISKLNPPVRGKVRQISYSTTWNK